MKNIVKILIVIISFSAISCQKPSENSKTPIINILNIKTANNTTISVFSPGDEIHIEYNIIDNEELDICTVSINWIKQLKQFENKALNAPAWNLYNKKHALTGAEDNGKVIIEIPQNIKDGVYELLFSAIDVDGNSVTIEKEFWIAYK
ncbi:MAG: DUF4625 domain-containing protein [Ichthyobacteriaceae bacterium]|nr:DUF4625 domain-containing protein [Ichthyobacteriaceae bacterium]